ncbi:MAG: single-stranded-DNA-specific exonuclease RecJ [Nitrospinae bacterium]|nr:single-stranded-DNA-specific exonuclease RecJ [Nitrospinota bacterium]
MNLIKNRWNFIKEDREIQESFSKGLSISAITAQLLINRGIDDMAHAGNFINSSLNNFHNPYQMKDMDKAVNRIIHAINTKEKIFIYGDYDVDGITATSLLILFLREMAVEASYYIPKRTEEGYGLNLNAVKKIKEQGGSLIITVDCGITAIEETKAANEMGIDMIITDHHQLSDKKPPAFAIIHPGQEDCRYPFKSLTGVGIVFKLIKSLRRTFKDMGVSQDRLPNLKKHLDLVSLGTIADIAPLLGENHIIAKYGLREITRTEKAGLKALKAVTGINEREVTVTDVGFLLCPRINAAGRLGDADSAVRLLTTRDVNEALEIARYLNSENKKRQVIQDDILKEVRKQISEQCSVEKDRAIVLSSPNWHQGVIGIVASKVVEEYYKPTILISVDGEYGKGSARGIPSFHLYEGLRRCGDLLVDFGGHKYAAGLTIKKDMIDEFRDYFQKVTAEVLKDEDCIPQIDIDMTVELSDMDYMLIEEIERIGPFGTSNPPPLFCSKGVKVIGEPVSIGKNNAHLKMDVEDGAEVMEVIGFNVSHLLKEIDDGGIYDIAYTPMINNWGNNRKLQLKLKDIRAAE